MSTLKMKFAAHPSEYWKSTVARRFSTDDAPPGGHGAQSERQTEALHDQAPATTSSSSLSIRCARRSHV